MAKKDQMRKREVYDIDSLCKAIDANAVKMEPVEYNADRMAIYGANVNLRRQIREIKDGLKPIHRRILMALYDLHLYNGKVSKSTHVIGHILRHYSPHGDSTTYNSLVKMAQPWGNNITFIQGVGNFGTAYDSAGYAHQRYTECTMSDFAYDCYFEEWKLRNPKTDMIVDWIPNFDESGLEPMYLPSKYPVFLLTWDRSMGIGRYSGLIGFNLKEAFEATIKLIKDPNAKFELYPDDPEGCDLVNYKDLHGVLDKIDLTAKMRATYSRNHYDGKDVIEITSAPFEVDPKTIKQAIRTAVEKGKLPEISDIDGCSSDYGQHFRLSIEVRRGYNIEELMKKLYKLTQLENTYVMKYAFVNSLESVDYTLRIAILEWIRARRKTLKRIYKSDLVNVMKRIHFLEPLIKVIESGQIDEFIKIVRNNKSEDAVPKIMKKWGLTDYQAERIIGVRIADLAKDKLQTYKDELASLLVERDRLDKITNHHKYIDEIIIKQLEDGIKKYGTPRKSEIMQLLDSTQVPDTLHYLIFTDNYVKKLPYEERGYKIGRIETNNKVRKVMVVNNRDTIALFTDDGRCTPIKVSDIGNSNNQSVGIAYTQCGSKNNGFVEAINISETEADGKYVVSVTTNGMISKTSCEELADKERSFVLMKLDKQDTLSGVSIATEDDRILIFTKSGKAAMFPFDDFETTSFNTKGVSACKLPEDDVLIGVTTVKVGDDSITLLTDRGYVKKIKVLNMPATKRNGRVVEINSSCGQLVDVISVSEANPNPMYICTTMGVFCLDHMNIKALNRLGKPERAAELKMVDYAFEIMYK